MANGLKAQQASYKSRDNAMAKNKQGWLALFSEDAVVQDPVGKSALDPVGEGHKGKAAIADFFDNVILSAAMDFNIEKSIPSGDECANFVTITHNLANGKQLPMDMIVVYTANNEGLITCLKAYWQFDQLTERMIEAMA